MVPDCYGSFDILDWYCCYECPYSFECEMHESLGDDYWDDE